MRLEFCCLCANGSYWLFSEPIYVMVNIQICVYKAYDVLSKPNTVVTC